jgi:hypothetical protein
MNPKRAIPVANIFLTMPGQKEPEIVYIYLN